VYNVQIIKRIQILNVTSRNSVQSGMYVESSMPAILVSKAYKHVNIMWIDEVTVK